MHKRINNNRTIRSQEASPGVSGKDHAGITTASSRSYASATRAIGCNSYGEQESDSLAADGATFLITETHAGYGYNAGFMPAITIPA